MPPKIVNKPCIKRGVYVSLRAGISYVRDTTMIIQIRRETTPEIHDHVVTTLEFILFNVIYPWSPASALTASLLPPNICVQTICGTRWSGG